MAGWELKEGKILKYDLSDEELWGIFNYIFSNKSANRTSYKFAFIKSLIECVFEVNEDNTIDLNVLFKSFTKIYWNLVGKYKLVQTHNGMTSKVESIIANIILENPSIGDIEFDKLNESIKEELEKQIFTEGIKYVVGAIYEDSKGCFYSFTKKDKTLTYNECFKKFIIKHNRNLLKINYFEWILFLEKVNSDERCLSLAKKLENASKRNDLSLYREVLFYKLQQKECFYCGKSLKQHKIHVDHFIPWSYIKSDKMWNFVLACPTCNTSKNDKIADEKYLMEIIERNKIISTFDDETIINDFMTYGESKLISIYKLASFNGFDNSWKPKMIKHKEIDEIAITEEIIMK